MLKLEQIPPTLICKLSFVQVFITMTATFVIVIVIHIVMVIVIVIVVVIATAIAIIITIVIVIAGLFHSWGGRSYLVGWRQGVQVN